MLRRKREDTEAENFKVMDDNFHIVMRAGASSILIVVNGYTNIKYYSTTSQRAFTIVARRPLQSIANLKEA